MAISANLEAFLEELKGELEELGPEIEGFDDYEVVGLRGDSNTENAQQIVWYAERKRLLEVAIQALRGLQDHAYPDKRSPVVAPVIHEDLQGQIDSMQAALDTYVKGPEPAVSGVVEVI